MLIFITQNYLSIILCPIFRQHKKNHPVSQQSGKKILLLITIVILFSINYYVQKKKKFSSDANIKSFCQREQLFYKKHYISG